MSEKETVPKEPKEPKFRIDIQTCSFKDLSLEALTAKLVLMKKLSFTKFYTIREEPDPSNSTGTGEAQSQ